ncbi:MAG: hypothetical protein KDJ70_01495 [Candidatus Competibacteraceae bacterium]|nr:hypothetical protein [Candidatus Competibacteraceae bacterium]
MNRRRVRVAERLGAQPDTSIPGAHDGWVETHAAYRLLAHAAVTWERVLTPHGDWSIEWMRDRPVVFVRAGRHGTALYQPAGHRRVGIVERSAAAWVVCPPHAGGHPGQMEWTPPASCPALSRASARTMPAGPTWTELAVGVPSVSSGSGWGDGPRCGTC